MEIRVSPKNKNTSIWNFVPKSGLKKFSRSTATISNGDHRQVQYKQRQHMVWYCLHLAGTADVYGKCCGLQWMTNRRLLIALDI